MISPNTIVGGRYRVVKSLGGGGMKLVYLAEDLRLAARRCALAEMVDSFTSPDTQQQAVAAFQREADMLAQLSNEHIPRIFDRFSEANHHYLVMEFIDGDTLEDELKRNGGKLEPSRVIEIAIQILDTLHYLHNLSPPVIYRDLKPSNVMVTRDGEAKLIDFGIARHFQPLSNATMIGTQGYAPPEQYRGKVEVRSDLYALGATMHQALSGRDPAAEPPFSFPPLRKLCPDIEPALAAIVDQALAYDVINRPASAEELRQRLFELKMGAVNGAHANTAGVGLNSPQNSVGGKPQMKLPLPVSQPQAQSAAQSSPHGQVAPRPAFNPSPNVNSSAPTVLSVGAEVACPGCRRLIPADSRFCSYCAADLRHTPRSSAPSTNPDADTIVLTSGGSATFPGASQHTSRAADRFSVFRRPPRHWAIALALIFVLAFAVTSIIRSYRESPEAPSSGAAVSPGGTTAPEIYVNPRLAALRRALNEHGYTSVKFRMEGETIVLSGTVPTEWDRAMVQTLVFTTAGIFSIEDHLRVRNQFGGP